MKLLVDMNVSPLCVPALRALGHDTVHRVEVGAAGAADAEIMAWARQQGSVVLTRDLDFSDMLGASGAQGPSVIQLRGDRLALADLAALVSATLRDHAAALEAGLW